MKTKTAYRNTWIRAGTWVPAFVVLAAQPLIAESRDEKREQPVIVPATVFQAAGPNAASIQSTVDQFRGALGTTNNGNAPGPLLAGRREINWDGGGSTNTSPGPTPFTVFLNSRG